MVKPHGCTREGRRKHQTLHIGKKWPSQPTELTHISSGTKAKVYLQSMLQKTAIASINLSFARYQVTILDHLPLNYLNEIGLLLASQKSLRN